MTNAEKLLGLIEAGYKPMHAGSLGVTLAVRPYYLPWRTIGPFLGRKRRRERSQAAVGRTIEHLAERVPGPWEARRREYLEEVGRREKHG